MNLWCQDKGQKACAAAFVNAVCQGSLAYVVAGECVLRYDNEAGKGDHRHVGSNEYSYPFHDPAQLLRDFWSDVDRWRAR
jgi:hypothetical protein